MLCGRSARAASRSWSRTTSISRLRFAPTASISRDPARVREARARLGPDRLLGASCGHSRHAAMLAGDDGADYIAFGEVGRPPQPSLLELIAWWNELFVLPCLAEGAFDDAGLGAAARAGADFIGVSDEVWRHPDGAAAGVRGLLATIAGG